MKTRYEMEKLFSVERNYDGDIKVIAGNTTKTYKDLPISTIALLFGLSEYVARSAKLFEKYVKPEQDAEFSARMLALVDREVKGASLLSSSTYNLQVGGKNGITRASVDVNISAIEYAFARATSNTHEVVDAVLHDIAVEKLIDTIK